MNEIPTEEAVVRTIWTNHSQKLDTFIEEELKKHPGELLVDAELVPAPFWDQKAAKMNTAFMMKLVFRKPKKPII